MFVGALDGFIVENVSVGFDIVNGPEWRLNPDRETLQTVCRLTITQSQVGATAKLTVKHTRYDHGSERECGYDYTEFTLDTGGDESGIPDDMPVAVATLINSGIRVMNRTRGDADGRS